MSVFLLLLILSEVLLPNLTCASRVRRQTTKVRISAIGDTIMLRFLQPHMDTKLQGYILGYGSNLFSKQFIQLPEDGEPYETEIDAEPKYLVAVQPVKGEEVKKQCTGKETLEKPLHLVIGSVTPTSVMLSWGTLLNTLSSETILDECIEDGHFTVRYREKEPKKKWNYQTCPTTETIIDQLKPDTPYEFGVRAESENINGAWSPPVIHNTAVDNIDIHEPVKPENFPRPKKPVTESSQTFSPSVPPLYSVTQSRPASLLRPPAPTPTQRVTQVKDIDNHKTLKPEIFLGSKKPVTESSQAFSPSVPLLPRVTQSRPASLLRPPAPSPIPRVTLDIHKPLKPEIFLKPEKPITESPPVFSTSVSLPASETQSSPTSDLRHPAPPPTQRVIQVTDIHKPLKPESVLRTKKPITESPQTFSPSVPLLYRVTQSRPASLLRPPAPSPIPRVTLGTASDGIRTPRPSEDSLSLPQTLNSTHITKSNLKNNNILQTPNSTISSLSIKSQQPLHSTHSQLIASKPLFNTPKTQTNTTTTVSSTVKAQLNLTQKNRTQLHNAIHPQPESSTSTFQVRTQFQQHTIKYPLKTPRPKPRSPQHYTVHPQTSINQSQHSTAKSQYKTTQNMFTTLEPIKTQSQPHATQPQSITSQSQPHTVYPQSNKKQSHTHRNQPKPSATQSPPHTTQPPSIATQSPPHTTQPQFIATESPPQTTQPQSIATQSQPHTTQFQTSTVKYQSRTAQPQPSTTQSQPHTSQPITIQSQPHTGQYQTSTVIHHPNTAQPQPSTTQSHPHTSQPQPITIQSQPHTTQFQTSTVKYHPSTAPRQPSTTQSQPHTSQPQTITIQSQPHTTQFQNNKVKYHPRTAQPQPSTTQSHPRTSQPQPITIQSQPHTTQFQTSTVKYHPSTAPRQPSTTQSQPHTSQPQTITIQSQPHTTQFQNNKVKYHPRTDQPQPSTTQSHPHTSQPQPQPFTTQSHPHTSQPQPSTTQSHPHTSQPQPSTTQSHPHTSQPQPITIQSQPHTTQFQASTVKYHPRTAQPQPSTSQSQPHTSQHITIQSQPQRTQFQNSTVIHHPGINKTQPTTTRSQPQHIKTQSNPNKHTEKSQPKTEQPRLTTTKSNTRKNKQKTRVPQSSTVQPKPTTKQSSTAKYHPTVRSHIQPVTHQHHKNIIKPKFTHEPNTYYQFSTTFEGLSTTEFQQKPDHHPSRATIKDYNTNTWQNGKTEHTVMSKPRQPVQTPLEQSNTQNSPWREKKLVNKTLPVSKMGQDVPSPSASVARTSAPTVTKRVSPVSVLKPIRLPPTYSNTSVRTAPASHNEKHKGQLWDKPIKRPRKEPDLNEIKKQKNKGPKKGGKGKTHDKVVDLKVVDALPIQKPSEADPTTELYQKPTPATTPFFAVNGSRYYIGDNSSVFSSVPVSEVDPMGKKRFVAPHVIYQIDKPPEQPCSVTHSLSFFPDEENSVANISGPPKTPPTNVTVVTVEGCPSFVIVDWEKTDNETTEYEVTSSVINPNGQVVSVVKTNQTHAAVENLKPESSYEFTVTPKNELGSGPSSEPVSFSTESADPRVREVQTGKNAIWSSFSFDADSYSECTGTQYVKRTWYRKFVGIQLCNSLRYKIYLSDSLKGKFYNIGDETGYGEDHCQFVDSFLDGRTGSLLPSHQLPLKQGYFRSIRQEPVKFGKIGGRTQINYVSWYECGVPIPGSW